MPKTFGESDSRKTMEGVRRSPRNIKPTSPGKGRFLGRRSVRALNPCFENMHDENTSPRKRKVLAEDQDQLPPSKIMRTTPESPRTPPKLAIKSFYSPRTQSLYQSPLDRACVKSSNQSTPSPLTSQSGGMKKKFSSPPNENTRSGLKGRSQKRKSPATALKPVLGQPASAKQPRKNLQNTKKATNIQKTQEVLGKNESLEPSVEITRALAEIPPGSPRSPVKNLISSSNKFFRNRSPRGKKSSQVRVGKGFNLSFQGRVPKSLQKKVLKDSNKRIKKPLTFVNMKKVLKTRHELSQSEGNMSRNNGKEADVKSAKSDMMEQSTDVSCEEVKNNSQLDSCSQSQELFSDYSNHLADSDISTGDSQGSDTASHVTVADGQSSSRDGKSIGESSPSANQIDQGVSEDGNSPGSSVGSVNLLTEGSDSSLGHSEVSGASGLSGRRFFPIFKPGGTPKGTPDSAKGISKKICDSNPGTLKNRSPSSPASSQGRRSPKLLKKLVDKKGKEQLMLDFGQKLVGTIQCEACGMAYTPGEPTDESTHSKFHQRIISALKFPGWKKERVLQEFPDGSRIIVVMPDEKQAMKKVETVRKIVDEDLGFVVDALPTKSNTKNFLYISAEEKKVVGFCIAEVLSQAYRVIEENDSENSQPQKGGTRAWCCSTTPEPARCGINRIWVLRSQRRNRIASKLLDCVRCNFMMGLPLRKEELAFTDPTPDGKTFAGKYTGTPRFLVYKHRS